VVSLMIEVEDVKIVYAGRPPVVALNGVSFSVPRGCTCAVIGPSGCGKTTLLYALAGLLHPCQGSIRIGGEAIRQPRRQTALVLQDCGLFPWKTVWDNAVLGLQIGRRRGGRGSSVIGSVRRGVGDRVCGSIRRDGGRGVDQDTERVAAILRELGLWELRRRFPAQLSGGQRQRVAIARALALGPDLLLMDEPFSSLDALTREVMQDLLAEIGVQLTWVLVTHDIAEAVFLGQKILVMDRGRIVEEIANPDALKQGYRSQPSFLELCSSLRGHLRLPTGVSRVA